MEASQLIGASLSEPHTSVTSLRSACVCLFAASLAGQTLTRDAPRYAMQGIVNCLATCSTDDSDNKDGETTRGH